MQRFNQTGGFHTLQRMYGCEIDDDGTIRGYEQLGYDGEDFISLDLEHVTWTAAKPQAVISKNKLDTEGAAPFEKFYLENICIEWLNKYVSHGRETLERKVRPEVSIFHKHSSPDVVCHTTGFYPKEVVITWKKDGEVMLEDVELRETLPNQDGSFQKRSILKVSAEELQKHNYTCVVQHSSLDKEIVKIIPRDGGSGVLRIGVLAAVLVIAVFVGFLIWKKKSGFTQVSQNMNRKSTEKNKQVLFLKVMRIRILNCYIMPLYSSLIRKTGGFHTLQRMYGCEIHDDGTIRGYEQLGYDGEDFISLDLEHVTWTAAKPQAVISKNKLNFAGAAPFEKYYLENICIEWLKKYASHGRETLERKVRPEVSIFHKHSSPDVVCHTTGFYPKEVVITWKKDGEVMLEDVELRETLPNQDGSFQKRSILKVSAEELQKHNYTCVVQHSSLDKEIVKIIPRDGGSGVLRIGVLAAVLVIAVFVGFLIWKKKSDFKQVPQNMNQNESREQRKKPMVPPVYLVPRPTWLADSCSL
ncbi:hypothetical protein KOW79_019609 [Hemibagrus wyckioides]|uniref:Ig-like domain-containing protein n=1 Tax=Hemibagrus wyckioides TaxID=337641 RepID=A0A9D3N705_9TELE|nr:hypothetical protein KOW79_019609 [Hemibagrus wyckioides]